MIFNIGRVLRILNDYIEVEMIIIKHSRKIDYIRNIAEFTRQ